jgi:hypothetical protein
MEILPYGVFRKSNEAGAMLPVVSGLVVVLVVSFAVFMAAIAPLRFLPVLYRIFPHHTKPLTNPNAVVWISKTAGTYFCADSVMFGKGDGSYMKQAKALDSGYQPALGAFCTGPEWPIPAERHADKSALPTWLLTDPTADLPAVPQSGPQGTKPLGPKPTAPVRPDAR